MEIKFGKISSKIRRALIKIEEKKLKFIHKNNNDEI